MAFSISHADFLSTLLTSGTACVTREELVSPSANDGLKSSFEAVLADFPGETERPTWYPDAAAAGLRFVYRLCQLLVDRAISEDEVMATVAAMPRPPTSAGEMLSMDLTLRHLPELHAMAKSMSGCDPLVTGLEQAARRFPLSGVGIPLAEPPPDTAALQCHPGLWRFYVDRVIERQDSSRLADATVQRAVVDALGEHALSLAPKLAARLALILPPSLPSSPSPHSHSSL